MTKIDPFTKRSFTQVLLGTSLVLVLACSDKKANDDDEKSRVGDSGNDTTSSEGGRSMGDSPEAGVSSPLDFPVEAIEFYSGLFDNTEGIAFNSEGRLFVSSIPTDEDSPRGVYEITVDGTAKLVNGELVPVGMAPAPDGDIFVCDAGPKVWPEQDLDGTVIRVSPDGKSSVWGTGIPDPNFVTVREDGALLVSDDFDDNIYLIPAEGGEAVIWYSGIESPNGMVFSLDSRQLFVAQTFVLGESMGLDNRVWVISVNEHGEAEGVPELLATLDENSANDGMTMDENGMLYVAANAVGKIFRVDPRDGSTVVIAENMGGVASLAFGKGDFNRTSIYATHLFAEFVSEVPVGVKGAPLF